MAATEKSVKASDPDWTVGTLMGKAQGKFYILDVLRQRVGPSGVKAIILSTAQADGPQVRICWELEPGSSGKLVEADLMQALAGYGAQARPVSGDKVQRAMPFLDQARVGNLKPVRGEWVPAWLAEVTAFPMGKHDDQVDSAAGAFSMLANSGPLILWEG
jgi:predicted phage terminase large subunit-like protein